MSSESQECRICSFYHDSENADAAELVAGRNARWMLRVRLGIADLRKRDAHAHALIRCGSIIAGRKRQWLAGSSSIRCGTARARRCAPPRNRASAQRRRD